MSGEHDPFQPHSHDPNLQTPAGDGHLQLQPLSGTPVAITVAQLQALPQQAVARQHIVSTGHGTSGPFTFRGAALVDVLGAWAGTLPDDFAVEVLSADGFGNRVLAHELAAPSPAGPILLATSRDDAPLTRAAGLVRLIVPGETDDALRQVKWVALIRVVAAS